MCSRVYLGGCGAAAAAICFHLELFLSCRQGGAHLRPPACRPECGCALPGVLPFLPSRGRQLTRAPAASSQSGRTSSFYQSHTKFSCTAVVCVCVVILWWVSSWIVCVVCECVVIMLGASAAEVVCVRVNVDVHVCCGD